MRLDEAILYYVEQYGAERPWQPATKVQHRGNLRYLFRHYGSFPLEDVTTEVIRTALADYDDYTEEKGRRVKQPKKHNTRRIMREIVRGMFKWLHENGLTPTNLAVTVRPMTTLRTRPYFLETPQRVLDMVAHLHPTKPHDVRDRVMVLVCYAAGLRAKELLSLMLRETSLWLDKLPGERPEKGTAVVHGIKREDDRMVDIPPNVTEELRYYVQSIRPLLLGAYDPGTLFVGYGGKPVGYSYWRKLITRLRDAAGIQVPITGHGLRHSFGMHMADGGVNPWDLKEMMGQKSIRSTEVYVQPNRRRAEKEWERVHPWAKGIVQSQDH